MKRDSKIAVILSLIAVLLLFFGCTSIEHALTKIGDAPSIVKLIVVALLAIYEIIVRLIPSVGTLSIIGWIINFLKWLSDALDRRKN